MDKQQMQNVGFGVVAGLVLGAVGVWSVSKNSASSAARSSCFLAGHGGESVLASIDGNEISGSNLPPDLQQTFLEAETDHSRRLAEISDEVAVRFVAAKEQNKSSGVSNLPTFKELVGEAVKDSDIREFYEKNSQSFPKMNYAQVEPMLRRHLEQQKQNSFVQSRLGDLKKNNRLLSKLPIPCGPKAAVSLPGGLPSRGTGSKVELAFLSDYQCGPCRYLKASLDGLLDQNLERMKLVSVMYPGNAGSSKEYLVRGAFCANKQANNEKFWNYHNSAYFSEVHYDNTGKVVDSGDVKKSALEAAKRATLDMATFEKCLNEKDADNFIAKTREYFGKIKVDQAPAFFLNDRRLAIPPQLNIDEVVSEVINEAEPAKKTVQANPKAEATKK